MKRNWSQIIVACIIAACLLGASPLAQAADRYWNGNDGSWDISVGNNWWGGVNPNSGDNLYFNNTTGHPQAWCNYGGGAWFGELIVYNGGGAIDWQGNTTYAYKFENFNNGSLFTISANIGNRSSPDTDLELNPVGSGGLTVNGTVTITGSKWIKVYGANTLTLGGVVSGSGATLALYQGATVIMNAENTFAGDLEIDQGIVDLRNTTDPLDVGEIRVGDSAANAYDATLRIGASGVTVDNTITVRSGNTGTMKLQMNTTGQGTLSGAVTLNKDVTVDAVSGGSLTMSGAIGGSGALTKTSTGTLTFSGAGANTYSGVTTVNAGQLNLNKTAGTDAIAGNLTVGDGSGTDIVKLLAANQIKDTVAVTVNSSGYLDLNGNSDTIGALSGSSGAIVTNSGAGVLTVNQSSTTTYAGAIKGAGGLTKSGTGQLTLSGANNYTGATTLSSGTLQINSGASIASATTINSGTMVVNGSSGNVTVNSGGFLKGGGTVGVLTINNGGKFSPGNSPGTENAGNTTWNSGGSYVWEINDVDAGQGTDPGWDFLNITGTLDIDQNFTVYVTSLTLANASGNVHDFNQNNDYTWTIATASGGLLNYTPGDIVLSVANWTNPYNGTWSIQTAGNSVQVHYEHLEVIPEPSFITLFLTGAFAIYLARRRGKKA